VRGVSVRVRFAYVLLAVATLLAGSASGQDPRASSAQAAARQFLLLIDRNDAKASWDVAGKRFQDAIDAPRWAHALDAVRLPLGAVVQRTLLSTQFTQALPDSAQEGDFAILLYRTTFAKKSDGSESVTLERGSGGVWRVVGYLIR
jgi:hypothetical protein